MNATPVIGRELRSESRNPVNYWIRVVAALVLMAPLILNSRRSLNQGNGLEMFIMMNLVLFAAAWIIIPVAVSDCVSRERREGTLGLLFLTPLDASGIILGKSTVNVLRAIIVFLAVVPVMVIPLLAGGVGKDDILRAISFNGATLILSVAASIAASVVALHWTRALILSFILNALFVWAFFAVPLSWILGIPLELEHITAAIFVGRTFGSAPAVTPTDVITSAALIFALSLVVLLGVISGCARYLRRNWQDKPRSERQEKMMNVFCSPRFLLGLFKKWKQRKLTANPIGWLQRYSWSSRLSTWGWCGLIVLAESVLVTRSRFSEMNDLLKVLETALMVSIAFSSVNSFQRERQTGALELILVTPIREAEMIRGRLRGIWGQFLPGFLVLVLSFWFVSDYDYRGSSDSVQTRIELIGSTWQFFTIPMVGLYFGLRFRSMIAAWALTSVLCIFLPKGFRMFAEDAMYSGNGLSLTIDLVFLVMGLILLIYPFVAQRKTKAFLQDRSFVLRR